MGRTSNASERREQIIWALYDCLVEKGQEKVTIKEIAFKAGLPPGVIHYYFKSKDDIVSNLAGVIVQKYSSMVQEHIEKAKSTAQQINYAIDFIIDKLIFDLPLNRVFYNLIQMTFERKELGSVVKKMFENYREQLSQVLDAAGVGAQSSMLGASLVAVTEGFSLQLLVDPDAFSREDVNKVFKQLIQSRLLTR
jgi:AcrR family transcriptional regulator